MSERYNALSADSFKFIKSLVKHSAAVGLKNGLNDNIDLNKFNAALDAPGNSTGRFAGSLSLND